MRANIVGIAPRVYGPIVQIPIKDNQPVKKEDLLFEIDSATYRAAVENASAKLQQAAAQALQAQQNLAREEELYKTKVVGAWDEWQQLTPAAKIAESELRDFAAKRIERVATGDVAKDTDANLSIAFDIWNKTVEQLRPQNGRSALVSRIAAEAQRLG